MGSGGILKELCRNEVVAYKSSFCNSTNNQAKIGAAIFGMTWALKLGYRKILLEMESMLTVKWIKQKSTTQ